jgi:hypothetical protein
VAHQAVRLVDGLRLSQACKRQRVARRQEQLRALYSCVLLPPLLTHTYACI